MASRNETSRSNKKTSGLTKNVQKSRTEGQENFIRNKRRKNYDTYKSFIQKILQDEHSGGIGSGALDIVDSFVKIYHDKIIHNADLILRHSKKKTLSEKEISRAVLLVINDELSFQANQEGNRAVETYLESSSSKEGTEGRSSKSSKADIVFPVSRIKERVKSISSVEGLRVGEKAMVFLTAVLEFLTRRLLKSAGEVALNGKNKHKRITARDIKLSIIEDTGFQELTKDVYIPGGVAVDPRK